MATLQVDKYVYLKSRRLNFNISVDCVAEGLLASMYVCDWGDGGSTYLPCLPGIILQKYFLFTDIVLL